MPIIPVGYTIYNKKEDIISKKVAEEIQKLGVDVTIYEINDNNNEEILEYIMPIIIDKVNRNLFLYPIVFLDGKYLRNNDLEYELHSQEQKQIKLLELRKILSQNEQHPAEIIQPKLFELFEPELVLPEGIAILPKGITIFVDEDQSAEVSRLLKKHKKSIIYVINENDIINTLEYLSPISEYLTETLNFLKIKKRTRKNINEIKFQIKVTFPITFIDGIYMKPDDMTSFDSLERILERMIKSRDRSDEMIQDNKDKMMKYYTENKMNKELKQRLPEFILPKGPPRPKNYILYGDQDNWESVLYIALKYLARKYPNDCTCIMENVADLRDIQIIITNTIEIIIDNKLQDQIVECAKNINYGRFIIIPIYIRQNQDAHSNMLIYDKTDLSLTRFEPHGGSSPFIMHNQIDILLDEKMKNILPVDHYYGPGHICIKGPQAYDNNEPDIKGESDGYCMIWSLWFADVRLANPNSTMCEIIAFMKMSVDNKKFKTFIRNYTEVLTRGAKRVKDGEDENSVIDQMITLTAS